VADKAVAGTTEGLKEYTIGVEAFGRREDFDPKTDPIVRVQIHRLRQKLKEYYDVEGLHDPILIEIPKGHYLPSFESAAAPIADLNHDIPHQGGGFSAGTHSPEPNLGSAVPVVETRAQFQMAFLKPHGDRHSRNCLLFHWLLGWKQADSDWHCRRDFL